MLSTVRAKHVIATLGLSLMLAACSSNDAPEYVERPVSELYNGAQDLLDAKEYQQAAEAFDEVERQHPYSV